MRVRKRLVVEGALAAWADRDLDLLGGCVGEHATYRLHLPEDAWPIAGVVQGKQRIIGALGAFLGDFDILEYRVLSVREDDANLTSRVKLHYGHKATGLSYEATIRNECWIDGDKISYFEVFHDTARLRAFYEMVRRMTVEA